MKSRRTNPRRRPATQADVKRAKSEAIQKAMKQALYLVLYVLIEKRGASIDEIRELAEHINMGAFSQMICKNCPRRNFLGDQHE